MEANVQKLAKLETQLDVHRFSVSFAGLNWDVVGVLEQIANRLQQVGGTKQLG